MGNGEQIHDYLIIGAGPGGLQLAYYMEKERRDYMVLEAGSKPGSFFEKFPRHGTLISSNKVHTGYDDPEINLRFDWNSLLSDDPDFRFNSYSREYFPPKAAMLDYLSDYAERYRLRVEYAARVASVAKADVFTVSDGNGRTWRGRRLIVATGVSKPFVPRIPGVELTESYFDVSVDAEDFAGQRVLVIGKGNSGFETAERLIPTTALIHVLSPNPLHMAWRTHFPGHLRAVNNNFLDTYQLKTQNAVLDGTIRKITRTKEGKFLVSIRYSHAEEEHEDLVYDRVITCTGFRFDDSIFDESCRPAMWNSNRLPEQTSEFESTNVPDLYFVGTLTQMRDYKKATSAFIHGFRYNVRALHRLLAGKYHGVPWPFEEVEQTPERLVEAMLVRINRTSALWQLFGFMADVIVLADEGDRARYLHELPVDYVQESSLSRNRNYFVVTLEFGKIVGDPFNILRHPDPQKADRSTFLHPVVRHYQGRKKIAELHLLENLFGEWWDPESHVKPLTDFIAARLRNATGVVSSPC
ncbi:MAG TPA: NAD(P)-binding domain-containing protein [Thermoanaerobaculia bacterium]|jgi:thioredoxin reductase